MIDWERAKVSLPLSPRHLAVLYPLYWRRVHQVVKGAPVPTRDLGRARAKLTSRAGTPAAIAWLTDTVQGLRLHPLLVQIADTSSPPLVWATPEEFWSYLATVVPHDELQRLGVAKLDQGQPLIREKPRSWA